MTAVANAVSPATVIQQSADAIIATDDSGNINLWNAAAEALFGYTADEALGSTLDLIVPADLRAPHWRGFERAIRVGHMVHSGHPTVTRARRRDGSPVFVTLSFAILTDEDGTVMGAVANAREAPPADPRPERPQHYFRPRGDR